MAVVPKESMPSPSQPPQLTSLGAQLGVTPSEPKLWRLVEDMLTPESLPPDWEAVWDTKMTRWIYTFHRKNTANSITQNTSQLEHPNIEYYRGAMFMDKGGYKQLLRNKEAKRPTLKEVHAECGRLSISLDEDPYIKEVAELKLCCPLPPGWQYMDSIAQEKAAAAPSAGNSASGAPEPFTATVGILTATPATPTGSSKPVYHHTALGVVRDTHPLTPYFTELRDRRRRELQRRKWTTIKSAEALMHLHRKVSQGHPQMQSSARQAVTRHTQESDISQSSLFLSLIEELYQEWQQLAPRINSLQRGSSTSPASEVRPSLSVTEQAELNQSTSNGAVTAEDSGKGASTHQAADSTLTPLKVVDEQAATTAIMSIRSGLKAMRKTLEDQRKLQQQQQQQVEGIAGPRTPGGSSTTPLLPGMITLLDSSAGASATAADVHVHIRMRGTPRQATPDQLTSSGKPQDEVPAGKADGNIRPQSALERLVTSLDKNGHSSLDRPNTTLDMSASGTLNKATSGNLDNSGRKPMDRPNTALDKAASGALDKAGLNTLDTPNGSLKKSASGILGKGVVSSRFDKAAWDPTKSHATVATQTPGGMSSLKLSTGHLGPEAMASLARLVRVLPDQLLASLPSDLLQTLRTMDMLTLPEAASLGASAPQPVRRNPASKKPPSVSTSANVDDLHEVTLPMLPAIRSAGKSDPADINRRANNQASKPRQGSTRRSKSLVPSVPHASGPGGVRDVALGSGAGRPRSNSLEAFRHTLRNVQVNNEKEYESRYLSTWAEDDVVRLKQRLVKASRVYHETVSNHVAEVKALNAKLKAQERKYESLSIEVQLLKAERSPPPTVFIPAETQQAAAPQPTVPLYGRRSGSVLQAENLALQAELTHMREKLVKVSRPKPNQSSSQPPAASKVVTSATFDHQASSTATTLAPHHHHLDHSNTNHLDILTPVLKSAPNAHNRSHHHNYRPVVVAPTIVNQLKLPPNYLEPLPSIPISNAVKMVASSSSTALNAHAKATPTRTPSAIHIALHALPASTASIMASPSSPVNVYRVVPTPRDTNSRPVALLSSVNVHPLSTPPIMAGRRSGSQSTSYSTELPASGGGGFPGTPQAPKSSVLSTGRGHQKPGISLDAPWREMQL